MSDEKVLTKEIAEQFLADEDSVGLSEFTAIEDEAAESLSKYDWRPRPLWPDRAVGRGGGEPQRA